MKVLTLNTHSWMEEQPYDKLDSLVDSIVKADYDVIALQEINQSIGAREIEAETFISPHEEVLAVPLKEDNFAYLLVEKLKQKGHLYYWSWTANHIGYDKYDEGVAILSKDSFESGGHLISASTDYASHYTRKVLKARIEREGTVWTVLSAHYSWWLNGDGEKLFENEWKNTLNLIKSDEKESVIVMGDFNNDPQVEQEGYSLIMETAPFLQDAFKAAESKVGEATVVSAIDGWEDHQDHKRIDYVFTSNTLNVDRYRVMFDGETEPVISDHYGVEVLIDKKLT
ncbi:MAG: endonuclease/exonuclease/phosphatase family protein [Alkalibacterium sp.]|nr:endonuclease/exonuclease/phosphatase family protein [Alkalibacterium sp.]